MTGSNNSVPKETGNKKSTSFIRFFSFLITFILMFLSWIVLSGKFDPLLLWLGGISSFFVAYYFYDLLFPAMEPGYMKVFFRFVRYTPWLMWGNY